MAIVRVSGYRHLTESDRRPPGRAKIFFDPADTEVGVWATVDLLEPACCVLDLGSGSGAAAAAVARAGAGSVHGLDISEESVRWASEHYAVESESKSVTFAVADFSRLSASELVEASGLGRAPAVVASNPPYVPIPTSAGSERVSVDGGADGLLLVRIVVRHASELGSHLGLTIGSYSSPRKAGELLMASGYRIDAVTLSALRLGEYTVRNVERVASLEAGGEGPLLRTDDGGIWYLIVGLSCRHVTDGSGSKEGLKPDELLEMLRLAAKSSTTSLEALDGSPHIETVPLRVVVLPDEPGRHHC